MATTVDRRKGQRAIKACLVQLKNADVWIFTPFFNRWPYTLINEQRMQRVSNLKWHIDVILRWAFGLACAVMYNMRIKSETQSEILQTENEIKSNYTTLYIADKFSLHSINDLTICPWLNFCINFLLVQPCKNFTKIREIILCILILLRIVAFI